MSQTQFAWYSLSISAAVFLISVPITFFPDNKSALIEFLSTLGLVAFIVSMLIKRGKFTYLGSEPVDIKRFMVPLGIVALGLIAGQYFQFMRTPIGRFCVFAVFIILWILLLRDAWKKYKAIGA